eukprot:CAMPEP_0174268810 /NCGR_PEP_ID=MMETSP0439-20130205/38788_1 /TAXON_ID=0 /ORGANISM="Stereomyxa ramosa, Strain Chinc5" /LENGTH=185 /DNA_ID=CAMNT_0015357219 /DNA_START=1089 /DNA_END=1643 /DNA_ORIENTATION=+
MDNMYHRVAVKPCISEYLGLPGVWSTDLGLPGPKRHVYPRMKSIPMGWSHSVAIAQNVHQGLMVEAKLDPSLEISQYNSPVIRSSKHGKYVDDFFCLGISPVLANKPVEKMMAVGASATLPAKLSKTVFADGSDTSTSLLGMDVLSSGQVVPNSAKFSRLINSTHQLLKVGLCTSKFLERIIGHW